MSKISQFKTILRSLGHTEEDTKLHKPNPEPYSVTARRLGIDPTRCIGFEDSKSGVKALRSAGMYTVGVLIGNHGTAKLQQADIVIPTLEALF